MLATTVWRLPLQVVDTSDSGRQQREKYHHQAVSFPSGLPALHSGPLIAFGFMRELSERPCRSRSSITQSCLSANR